MEKEFVPFRSRGGLPVWPNGKRLAVALYVAIEEWNDEAGAEYTNPPPLAPPLLPHMTRPDLGIRSSIEYGYRVGIWRILDMLAHHAVTITVIANGLAVERHPGLFRELTGLGYDFVAHGYDQCRLFTQLPPDEQVADIDRCVRAFEDVTGVRVRGWGSPWTRQYEETLELLVERQFEFHQGLHDDELPYLLHFGKGSMVEVPYRITESGELNDYYMYHFRDYRVGEEIMRYCRALIDARYRDAALRPQLLVIGAHPEVTGRPDHLETLSEVIGYLKSLPGVWLTTMGGIAARWREVAGALPVATERARG